MSDTPMSAESEKMLGWNMYKVDPSENPYQHPCENVLFINCQLETVLLYLL